MNKCLSCQRPRYGNSRTLCGACYERYRCSGIRVDPPMDELLHDAREAYTYAVGTAALVRWRSRVRSLEDAMHA